MLKLDSVENHTLITLTCDAYDRLRWYMPTTIVAGGDLISAPFLPIVCERKLQVSGLQRALAPAKDNYVALKPKHSAFYATSLDTLLKTRVIILARLTTSACILLTACELYVRDFEIFIPTDCVAIIRCCHQD